jgi:hypothetical protein
MTTVSCPDRAEPALADSRVLLVCPETFDYHRLLHDELRALGAEVDMFAEPLERTRLAVVRRLGPQRLEAHKDVFRRKVLASAAKSQYDHVVVIRGEFLNRATCQELRRLQPRARLVSYQWDPLACFDYRSMIDCFDQVTSFDRADCQALGLRYMPLFYSHNYAKWRHAAGTPRWDLSFVGTLHSDRWQIALKLAEQAQEAGLSIFFYIYMKWSSYLKQAWIQRIIPRRVPFLSLRIMSTARLEELVGQSRAVVDINKPEQTGLTIRTLETLGAGRKLITTNAQIRLEPFYSPNMVDVIDRHKPRLDADFVRSPPGKIEIDGQRIDNWLLDLLGEKALMLQSSTDSHHSTKLPR